MFKQIFLPIIAVAAFITIVGLLGQGKLNFLFSMATPSPKPVTKQITLDNKTKIDVEVARTSEERSKGLSNRDSLSQNSGMVFVFTKDSKPTFWMKETKISLDIIWIDNDKVIGIEKNVPTELGKKDSELKRYPAPAAIDYVLEVNSGFSDTNGIKIGSSVQKLSDL